MDPGLRKKLQDWSIAGQLSADQFVRFFRRQILLMPLIRHVDVTWICTEKWTASMVDFPLGKLDYQVLSEGKSNWAASKPSGPVVLFVCSNGVPELRASRCS